MRKIINCISLKDPKYSKHGVPLFYFFTMALYSNTSLHMSFVFGWTNLLSVHLISYSFSRLLAIQNLESNYIRLVCRCRNNLIAPPSIQPANNTGNNQFEGGYSLDVKMIVTKCLTIPM